MLSYVCSKHLNGESESLTEWAIAVEGLGRRPDFSPEKDSIVRVEFHHLRKRLTKFYEAEGAGHSIRIAFPDTGYVPRFIAASSEHDEADQRGQSPSAEKPLAAQILAAAPQAPALSAVPPVPFAQSALRLQGTSARSLLVSMALTAAVLAVMAFALLPGKSAHAKSAAVPVLPPQDSIRLLAGFNQPMYVDGSGQAWTGDRFFTGGVVFSRPDIRIFRTPDSTIYNQGREGDFRYDIPLKSGVYELRLHFAETRYGQLPLEGADAERRFNVTMNGKTLLEDFDITKDSAESGTATVKTWNDVSPASDGLLHLAFSGHSGPPMVNGIEIVPGVSGRVLPIRMVCGLRPVYDRDSRFWNADQYFRGGRSLGRKKPVRGDDDPSLFQSVRFGNFSYAIPVVPGRTYQVSLWFADSTYGQPGRRLFDIFCNGKLLTANFDIVKNAGGEGRGVKRVFPGLAPNAQGKLNLSFVPNRDYASLSAIEVLAEDSL